MSFPHCKRFLQKSPSRHLVSPLTRVTHLMTSLLSLFRFYTCSVDRQWTYVGKFGIRNEADGGWGHDLRYG